MKKKTVRATTAKDKPVKRKGRGPSKELEQKIDWILRVAAELFAERGFEVTSLKDIAERADISKAAIYHYFPTKQDIYASIFLFTQKSLCSFVEDNIDAAASPEQRLMQFMNLHATFFHENHSFFMTSLIGWGGRHADHSDAVIWRDRHEANLRAIIREGVKSGAFGHVDPATVSRAVFSLLNWMVRWYDPEGQRSASAIAKDYAALLLHGILAKK